MQTRCHSVFEDHSSCVFFQDRCVATERTVKFAPLLRDLTLLRVRSDESDDCY